MTTEKRPDIVIDIERLKNNCRGNIDIVRELLTHLVDKSGPDWLKSLEDALADGDAKQLKTICHSIKGSAATVFAWRMSNLGLEMERLVIDGKIEQLGQKVSEFDSALKEMRKWSEENLV